MDLDRYLLRRRLRRWLATAAVAVVVVLIAWADHRGWLLYRGGGHRGGVFRVLHVIDGDSIEVDDPTGNRPSTTVHLRGIKAPDPAAFGQPASHLACAAADYTRRLCEGQMVRLLLERGASEAHLDTGGRSARDMALEAGYPSIADRLKHTIELSADIDTTSQQKKQTKK